MFLLSNPSAGSTRQHDKKINSRSGSTLAVTGTVSGVCCSRLDQPGKVVELTSTNQLRYLVTLRVAANPSGCRNKVVFYQDHHASGSQQMFRILLEAASTGNLVRVYVTGNCELNGYSEISSVSIVP
jgi:hypothetical protein